MTLLPAVALPGSGIREIVHLVLDRGADAIDRLEVGEPDSRPPAHVLAAAAAALDGPLGYTQSAGTLELRSALVDRLARFGIDVPLRQVIVGQGAVQAIAGILGTVVGAGDEVLVPDPAWPNYEMQTLLYGGRPVRYRLHPDLGFLPDPEELLGLIGPKTRVLVLNSPSNPAGSVIDAARMEAIVRGAADRGVLVISDEVYDEIVFDGHHVGARQFAPESVVSVFSFSKTYSMTGWRVGYAVVPEAFALVAERVQETLLSCVSTLSQVAAVAALEGPQDAIAANLGRYRRRRDAAVARLAEAGIEVPVPGGAFYLMVPLAPGADSRQAALDLVEVGVSVAPGSAFGDVARDYVRLSLASADDVLERGIDRLVAWRAATGGGLATTRR